MNTISLMSVAMVMLNFTTTAIASESLDDVFWRSVNCKNKSEVELYLSEFDTGNYRNSARKCLDEFNSEANRIWKERRNRELKEAQRKEVADEAAKPAKIKADEANRLAKLRADETSRLAKLKAEQERQKRKEEIEEQARLAELQKAQEAEAKRRSQLAKQRETETKRQALRSRIKSIYNDSFPRFNDAVSQVKVLDTNREFLIDAARKDSEVSRFVEDFSEVAFKVNLLADQMKTKHEQIKANKTEADTETSLINLQSLLDDSSGLNVDSSNISVTLKKSFNAAMTHVHNAKQFIGTKEEKKKKPKNRIITTF